MYDVLANQWTFIPRMVSARSGVSLVAFKNTLYALGGFNGYTRLTTCEKYSPTAATGWSEAADMLSPRSNFATVVLDEMIFVIGGFNGKTQQSSRGIPSRHSYFVDRMVTGSTTINFVECYDPDADEWFDAAPMNLNRSALNACVISGLPNARDYALAGRSQGEVGQGAGVHQERREQVATA